MKIYLGYSLSVFMFVNAHADIPTKAPLAKYANLWNNSPFTSKPPPVNQISRENPFDEYILTGIAPVPGGYRITVMSKKNQEDKIVIDPDKESKFKVISVNRNPHKSLGTSVTLTDGLMQGTVTFQPDLVTIKSAPPVATPADVNGLPPGVILSQDQNAQQQPVIQPRPRIIAPPLPQNTPQPGNRPNRPRR